MRGLLVPKGLVFRLPMERRSVRWGTSVRERVEGEDGLISESRPAVFAFSHHAASRARLGSSPVPEGLCVFPVECPEQGQVLGKAVEFQP